MKYHNNCRSETESERDLDGIDVVSFLFPFCWTCDFDCCYFSVLFFSFEILFFDGGSKSGFSKSILRHYTRTNIEAETIPSNTMMNK